MAINLKKDQNTSNKKIVYIVAQILGYGSLQPVFSDDNGLMTFATVKEAKAEIKDTINDINEAIKAGDMDKDSKMSRNDYEILVATIEGNVLTCEVEGDIFKMDISKDDDWTKQ